MFENKAGILLIGGLGFFVIAFVSNAVVPMMMYQDLEIKPVAELTNANLMYQFEDLQQRFPESFEKYFGEPTAENCAEALEIGHKVYVAEGCWHCHSQFVRPVSNDSRRFGQVAASWEYQNKLQQPVLFGTRRVGPDLSREGGRRSNDWHAVHFLRPTLTSAESPMPEYPWFFDPAPSDAETDEAAAAIAPPGTPDPRYPNQRGLALMTYVQWLGSWLESYPNYENYTPLEVIAEE